MTLDDRVACLEQLRDILIDDLFVAVPREHLEPDAPLFEGWLGLDSVDAVELLALAEERFEVRLEGPQVTRSLNLLADAIGRAR